MSTSFHDRLREALAARPHISQGKLEELAELADSYVSKLIQGKRPNPGYQTVLRIAEVLAVDPMWLMTGRGLAPSDPEPSYPGMERFQNRVPAVAVFREEARELGHDEAIVEQAIRQVAQMVPVPPADLPIRRWVLQLHATYAEMRSQVGRAAPVKASGQSTERTVVAHPRESRVRTLKQ